MMRASLTLDTRGFRRGVNTAVREANRIGGSMSRGMRGAKGAVAGVTGALIAAAGAARGLGFAVKTIAGFDQEMANIRAISEGVTEEVFVQMEAEARRLGATTKFTASEAAEAMRLLKQGGLSAEESIAGLEATMHLASAGSLDMASTAEIAVKQFNVFRKAGISVKDVGDILSVVAANSATDVHELSEAMKFASGISSNFGQDIKEVTGLLGAMASVGQNGEMAGTAVRGLLADLSDPTSESVKKLKAIGVAYEDINPRANSLADVMTRLTGDSRVMANYTSIFQKRVGQGFGAIAQNRSGFVDMLERLKDASGAVKKMSDTKMDSLTGDALTFRSAMEEAFLRTGSTGFFRSVVQGATSWVRGAQEGIGFIRSAMGDPEMGMTFRNLLVLSGKSFVNHLYRGLRGVGAAFGTYLVEAGKNVLFIFDTIRQPSFWKGLSNVFMGLGNLFAGILRQFLSDALRKLGEATHSDFLKGKADDIGAVADQNFKLGKGFMEEGASDLGPHLKALADRSIESILATATAFGEAYREAGDVFDTSAEVRQIMEFAARIRGADAARAAEIAAKNDELRRKGTGGPSDNERPGPVPQSERGRSATLGSVAGAINAIFGRSINADILNVNKRQAELLDKIAKNTSKPPVNTTKTVVPTFPA